MAFRRSMSSKVGRLRDWIWWLASVAGDPRHPLRCYVCGKKLDPTAFLTGDATDGLVPHHLSMKRSDHDPNHSHPAHRSCHRRFHRQLEENGIDIRLNYKLALRFFGPTPKTRSDKSRTPGSLRQWAQAQ